MQNQDDILLRGVNPELADRYRRAKQKVKERTGYDLSIAGGSRSRATQQKYYNQGKTPYTGDDPNAPHLLGLAVDLNWKKLPANIRQVATEELSGAGLRQGSRMKNGYDEHHHWQLPAQIDSDGDIFAPVSNATTSIGDTTGPANDTTTSIVDSDGDEFTTISGSDGQGQPQPVVGTIPSQNENPGTEGATSYQSAQNSQNVSQNFKQDEQGNWVSDQDQQVNPELEKPTGEMANAANFTDVSTGPASTAPKISVKGNTAKEVFNNSILGVDKNTVGQLSALSAQTVDPQANIPFDFTNAPLVNAYDAYRKASLLHSEKGYEIPDSPALRRQFVRYLYDLQSQAQAGTDPNTAVDNARTDTALAIIQELSTKANRPISPDELNTPEYAWIADYLTDPKTKLSNDQLAFINKYSNRFATARAEREQSASVNTLGKSLTYSDFSRQYPTDPETALQAYSEYSKQHAASTMIDVTEAKPGNVGQFLTKSALSQAGEHLKVSPEAITRTETYLQTHNLIPKNYSTGQEIKNIEDTDNPVTIGGRTFVKYDVPLEVTERLKDEQEKISKGISDIDAYVIQDGFGNILPVDEKAAKENLNVVKLTSDERLNLSRVSSSAASEYLRAKQYDQTNEGMTDTFVGRELRSYGGELANTQSNTGLFFSMMSTKLKRIFTGNNAKLSPEEENYYDSLQSRSQAIFNFGQNVIPVEEQAEAKPGQKVASNGHPILRATLGGVLRTPQFVAGAIAPDALVFYNAIRDFNKPASEFVHSTLTDLAMLGSGHLLSSVTAPILSNYLESTAFSKASKFALAKIAGAAESGTLFAGVSAAPPLLKKLAGGQLTPEETQSLTAPGLMRHFMTGVGMTLLSSIENIKDFREALRPDARPIGDLYVTTREDGTPEFSANFKLGKTVEMLSLKSDHPFVQNNLDNAVHLDPENFDRQLILSRLANRYKEGTPEYNEAVKRADDYTQNAIKDAVESDNYQTILPEFASLTNEDLKDTSEKLSEKQPKGTSKEKRQAITEAKAKVETELANREEVTKAKEAIANPESRQPTEYDVPSFQEYVENEKGVKFSSLSPDEASQYRDNYTSAYPESLASVAKDREATIPEHKSVVRVEVTRGSGAKENLLFVGDKLEEARSRAQDFIDEVKKRNSDINISLPSQDGEEAGVLSQGERALRNITIVDPKVEKRIAEVLDYSVRGVKVNDSEMPGRVESGQRKGQEPEQVSQEQAGRSGQVSPSRDVQENGREEKVAPIYHGTLKLLDTNEKVNFKYGGAPHILDLYDKEGKLSRTIDTTHPDNKNHQVLAYDLKAESQTQNRLAASELTPVQNTELPSVVKSNDFGSRTSKLGKVTHGLAQNEVPITISDGKAVYGNEKGLEVIRQALPDVKGKDEPEVTRAFTIDPQYQQEVLDNLNQMTKDGVEGAKTAAAQVKNLIKQGRKGISLIRTYSENNKIVSTRQTPIDKAHEVTHSNVFTHLGNDARDVIRDPNTSRTLTGKDGSVRTLWEALPDDSYYKIPEKALGTNRGKALLYHEVLAFGATGDWKGLGVEPKILNQAFKDVVDALMTEHPHSTVRKILDDALINGDRVYEEAIKRFNEKSEGQNETRTNQSLADTEDLQSEGQASSTPADRQVNSTGLSRVTVKLDDGSEISIAENEAELLEENLNRALELTQDKEKLTEDQEAILASGKLLKLYNSGVKSDGTPEYMDVYRYKRTGIIPDSVQIHNADSLGDWLANQPIDKPIDKNFEPTQLSSIGLSRVENQRVVLNAVVDPKFQEWFGNSKVKDEDDKPLVVYHGTREEFNQFYKNMIGKRYKQDTRGFFFTDDAEMAGGYSGIYAGLTQESFDLRGYESNNQVIPAFLSIKNPLIVNVDYDPINEWDSNHIYHQRYAELGNHDGVIIKAETGPSMYIPFEPEQIKSVFNRGAWGEQAGLARQDRLESLRSNIANVTSKILQSHISGDVDIDKLRDERLNLSREIGEEKRKLGLPTYDPVQEARVLESVKNQAIELGMNPNEAMDLAKGLIEDSKKVQNKVRAKSSGSQFSKFFTDITNKEKGVPNVSDISDVLLKPTDGLETELDVLGKHTGNFDAHIFTSIPGYLDTRLRILKGIEGLASKKDAPMSMLDIGASEGSFPKAAVELSGKNLEADSLDPNPAMQDQFNKISKVQGTRQILAAWGEGFTDEPSGQDIPEFVPDKKYHVVYEGMGFQFFTDVRKPHLDSIKKLMEKDGIFVTQEKFKTPDFKENEKPKDIWKNRFFSKEDIEQKAAQILQGEQNAVGMIDNMVEKSQFEKELSDKFKYVAEFWSSGNFAGYVGGDDINSVYTFLKNVGDTTTEFSTTKNKYGILRNVNWINEPTWDRAEMDKEYYLTNSIPNDPEAIKYFQARVNNEASIYQTSYGGYKVTYPDNSISYFGDADALATDARLKDYSLGLRRAVKDDDDKYERKPEDVKPSSALSADEASQTPLEQFTPDHVKEILDSGRAVILSGVQQPSDQPIINDNEKLRKELIDLGFTVLPASGNYQGTTEPSLFVPVTSAGDFNRLRDLAKKYNQIQVMEINRGSYSAPYISEERSVENYGNSVVIGDAVDSDSSTVVHTPNGDFDFSVTDLYSNKRPARQEYILDRYTKSGNPFDITGMASSEAQRSAYSNGLSTLNFFRRPEFNTPANTSIKPEIDSRYQRATIHGQFSLFDIDSPEGKDLIVKYGAPLAMQKIKDIGYDGFYRSQPTHSGGENLTSIFRTPEMESRLKVALHDGASVDTPSQKQLKEMGQKANAINSQVGLSKKDDENTYYHGTTEEQLKSINAKGINKSSFVTPDIEMARKFAQDRADWNGKNPVVLKLKAGKGDVEKVTSDRSGRPETTLRTNIKPLGFARKPIKDWEPQDWEEYGKQNGIEDSQRPNGSTPKLGPLSPLVSVDGQFIPGGTDGHFTYYDMLWMKANPLAAKSLSEATHVELIKKLSRSVTPSPHDNLESFNRMMFGMLSPGTGLAPNEFAYSQVRARDENDVRKLASYSDEIQERITAGENPKDARLTVTRKMKVDFGIGSKDSGGLGLAVHADLSNLAEAAKQYLADPTFFNKKPDESWTDLAVRMSEKLRGVGTKVAMFSTVWQDPGQATTGAIDIHMSRIFLRDLIGEENFPEFEKKVVKSWNDEHPDELFPVEKIDDIIKEKTGQTWITNNFLNQLVSGKGADISAAYQRALDVATAEAKKLGLSTFETQWMLWDRQRNRIEPHETMFPGLYKLPKPSREEMMSARDAASEAGYFGTKPTALKATSPVSKLGYFLKPATDPEIAPFIEDSKVKEPVFHGTDTERDFNKFEKKGYHNQFFFTPNKKYANEYAGRFGRIIPVYLNIKNPLNLDSKEGTKILRDINKDKSFTTFEDGLRARGYDGTIQFKGKEISVLDSSQIKSAISPESPERTALGYFNKSRMANYNLETRDDTNPKTTISNDTIREIIALNKDQADKDINDRLSQTDIANHYGISPSAVNFILKQNNETPYGKAAKTGEDRQAREATARQMLLDGKKRDEITKATGLHNRVIAAAAKDLGLDSKRNNVVPDVNSRRYKGNPNGKRIPLTLNTGAEAGNTLFADSTYEAGLWDYLDDLASQKNSPIETWTPRVTEKPKYTTPSGREATYTPDVYVKFKPSDSYPDGREVIFEVKPGSLVNEPLNVLKAEAGLRHFGSKGMDYLILTGDDIGKDRIRAMADKWTPPEGFDSERANSIRKTFRRVNTDGISGRDVDYMNPDLYQGLGLFNKQDKGNTEDQLRKEFNGIAWMDAALKNSKNGQLSAEDSQEIRQLITQGENAQTDEERNATEVTLTKKVASLNPDGILKFLTTMRRAGMISGVKTVGKIITTDTLFQGLEEASRLPAGFIDMTQHLLTGSERSVQGVSPRAIFHSVSEALTKGVTAAAREFKGQGQDTDLLRQTSSDYGTGYAVAKPFETVAKYIFRTHGALYSFFSEYAKARSLYEAAWLESKNGGRSLQDALANPTPEQTDAAARAGLAAIFLNDNALNSAYQKFRGNRSDIVKFLLDYKLPFAKIGANVFEKVLDYSGIRSLYKSIESEPGRQLLKGNFSQAREELVSALHSTPERAEIIRAFSRGLIGWGLILTGYALQRKGLLTGFASQNPAVNKTEELKGSGPGNIKINGHWYDISQLSPVATLMQAGASVGRDANDPNNKDYNSLSNLRDIFFNALKEQPLVSGLSDTLNPNVKANFGTEAADFIGLDSFISNLVGEVAQDQDDSVRDTSAESFLERIKKRIENKIPNLGFNSGFNREQLPVKTDTFGTPLQNPLGQDPFKTKRDITTPLTQEMTETGFGVTPPQKLKSRGDDDQLIEETIEDYDIRKASEGKSVKRMLEEAVGSSFYPKGSDIDIRRATLSTVTRFAKKEAKDNALSDEEENYDVSVLTARENFKNQVETHKSKMLKLDSDDSQEFFNLTEKERNSMINSIFNKALLKAKEEDLSDAQDRFNDILFDTSSAIETALANRRKAQIRKSKKEKD